MPEFEDLVRPHCIENNLVIGSGVSFSGTINVPGKAIIDGEFGGDLKARDVEVGVNGRLIGHIHAQFLDVRGKIFEHVSCSQVCLIRSTGVITGTLEYGQLEIERGGVIKGTLNA